MRLKNLLKKGELYTPGDTPVDCDLKAGLLQAAEEIGWSAKKKAPGPGKALGRGLAVCMKDGGGTYKVSSAAVKMNADGSVVLLTGTVEVGQGARTALSQVVAEELGIPYDAVTVAQLDTDVTPYDVNTNASSSTVVMGLSVQRAAQDLKRQLLRHAAQRSQNQTGSVVLGRRQDRREPRTSTLPFVELMQKVFLSRSGEMIGRGAYQSIKSPKAALGSPTNFWEISWGGAEVEVDRDTGEIKLLKYVSLADVGKAIHPVLCEGQDEGGVMNAIGHSLLEEMVYKDGQLLNPNLVDYRVPSFHHLPKDFETILVESQNGPGPFGAKGTGEGGLLPVAAAIANARLPGDGAYDSTICRSLRKKFGAGFRAAWSNSRRQILRAKESDVSAIEERPRRSSLWPSYLDAVRRLARADYSGPLIRSINKPSGKGTFNIFSNNPQKNSQAKNVTIAVICQFSPPATLR